MPFEINDNPEPTETPEETTVEPVVEPDAPSTEKPVVVDPDDNGLGEAPRVTDQRDHLYSNEVVDRKTPATDGIYYDDLKRMEAENERARKEGREPNYDTMGGIASTPLLRGTER